MQGQEEEAPDDKHKRIVNECAQELHTDAAYFIPDPKMVPTHPFDPKKFSCMKKCVWQKKGHIDENINFGEAAFRADTPEMPNAHINIIKNCLSLTAKNISIDCSAFREFDTCVNAEFKKMYEENQHSS